MIRWSAALLALLTGLLLACRPALAPPTAHPSPTPTTTVSGEVVVFAAASLTDAFKEIGAAFSTTHPGTTVTFNFGASSQLRAQLEQGARADVFASADQAQMERAQQAGLLAEPPRVFARNRLVIAVPRDNPGGVQALRDLARPGLRLVTAAPEVPIGVYTQQLLDRAAQDPAYGPDFPARVGANIVSREPNVRQVVAKVALGEADAAIVYQTDITPDLADKVRPVALPEALTIIATYPIALLRQAPNPTAAAAFIAFVLGPDGQTILQRWGFLPAGDTPTRALRGPLPRPDRGPGG